MNYFQRPEVRSKFVKVIMAINNCQEDDAERIYELESYSFLNLIDSKGLSKCSSLSVGNVFLEVLMSGYSFNPDKNHVYLMSRNSKRDEGWEKILTYTPTHTALLEKAKDYKDLERITSPQVIYEGESVEIVTNDNGSKYINHSANFDNTGAKIIGGYCYKVFKNGDRELVMVTSSDIESLKKYSAIENGRWDKAKAKKVPGNPNALYTKNDGQIDIGFLKTKIVKQALKH
jgi:recombinational DNA repair protein RecT